MARAKRKQTDASGTPLTTQIPPCSVVPTRGSHFDVQTCMANRLFRAVLSGMGSGRDLQELERKCRAENAVKTGREEHEGGREG